MEVLGETMNSVCYIYNEHFRNLEELRKASAEEELAKSVDVLPCKAPYHVMHQSEPVTRSHDVFESI